ncbi:MAG: UPF0149 family protein [Gammaproteobacteria bacterium]|nr:UPF0149 family protein [Gammaproteobacteria bacterium]
MKEGIATSAELAKTLGAFLNAPERPEGTFTLCELAGFLFAMACSPEPVETAEWLPEVFQGQAPGYHNAAEAKAVAEALNEFYQTIKRDAAAGAPNLPLACVVDANAMENLAPEASLSLWARGFAEGHDWLSQVWDAYLPEAMEQELSAALMVLICFTSREVADSCRIESTEKNVTLEAFVARMLTQFSQALGRYAQIGLALCAEALAETPVRSEKVGRNDPCPCGSGKKYKKCCGAE